MADQKDKNEMTLKKLQDLADNLFDAAKYDELIALLDDDILTKHNNERLYRFRGLGHEYNNETDEAYKYYDTAVRLEPNATNYYNRGVIWNDKGEYDKAIADYNEAIKISVNYVDAYNNRGNSWSNKREYDKAIADYNEAIKINPNDADLYYNRGNSWDFMGEYDKAIADFNEAIRIKPNYAAAYNNRGYSLENKGEYELALADFNEAFRLEPNSADALNNRGVTFESKGEYELALADYEKANQLDPGNVIIETNRNKAASSLKLCVNILNETQINRDDRRDILDLCAKAKREGIDKIRSHAGSNTADIIKNSVAHYTKLTVADIIASDKKAESKLRYYNAVYMNDPEEGIVLLDAMGTEVKQCFANASQQEEGNIYIGSFLPADTHEDELVMWRTYGKDENGTEAAGCSIVINTDFFDAYQDHAGINPHMHTLGTKAAAGTTPQCLYRVLYFNKNHRQNKKPMIVGDIIENGSKKGNIEKDILALNDSLIALGKLKVKNKPTAPLSIAIDKIIFHLLSEVRFFFKSSDYSFENEVRVIQYVPKDNNQLKIDESKPKKVYVDSNKPIQQSIEKIILGPKVPSPKQWLYLDVALRQNNPTRTKPVDVSISECKYQ
ncbi:MAG: tetratricopeptide repeat protein [Bacteroidetes bacterium]|nr:tetratricopeptide repeat protein [Bacteroidota bacterium]